MRESVLVFFLVQTISPVQNDVGRLQKSNAVFMQNVNGMILCSLQLGNTGQTRIGFYPRRKEAGANPG